MARSGSTLICKCLGCMDGIALLSEIHPRGVHMFNPLRQAQEWFALFSQKDLDELQQQGALSFRAAIELIDQRCKERGKDLVVRDWGHLDYTGHPFTTPGYTPAVYAEVADRFEVLRLCTTRDPVSQWLSLIKLDVMQQPLRSGVLGLDQFMRGYRKYAELCAVTGFIRYEDFVRKPELQMRRLCNHLKLNFDRGFEKKWLNYETITGDVGNPRGLRKIKAPSKPPVDPVLQEKLHANADYHRACKLLGYDVLGA